MIDPQKIDPVGKTYPNWIIVGIMCLWLGFASDQAMSQQPIGKQPIDKQPTDALWGTHVSPLPTEGVVGRAATYKVLPRLDSHGRVQPPTMPPTMVSKPLQPYAYGWFGVKGSPTWYRSFGHQNARTQWTLK